MGRTKSQNATKARSVQSMRELPFHNRAVCSNDLAEPVLPRHATYVGIDLGSRPVCRKRYTNGGFTWPSNNLDDTYPLVLSPKLAVGDIHLIRNFFNCGLAEDRPKISLREHRGCGGGLATQLHESMAAKYLRFRREPSVDRRRTNKQAGNARFAVAEYADACSRWAR